MLPRQRPPKSSSAAAGVPKRVFFLSALMIGALIFGSIRYGRPRHLNAANNNAQRQLHEGVLSRFAGPDDSAWHRLQGEDDSQPSPSVCVIVRTYHGQKQKLLTFTASLAAAAPPELSIVFVDTDKQQPFSELPDIAAGLNRVIFGERPVITVSPRSRRANASQIAFPSFTKEDHGYILTDLVVEDLLQSRREARDEGKTGGELGCEWMLITNGDNIYHSLFFLAALQEAAAQGADLLATHFVSRYDWPGSPIQEPLWEKVRLFGQCGPWRPGRDVEVATAFKPACVDLGAVLLRSQLLEDSGARFIVDRLRADPSGRGEQINPMEADGELFAKLTGTPGVKSAIVRRTLMVHQ